MNFSNGKKIDASLENKEVSKNLNEASKIIIRHSEIIEHDINHKYYNIILFNPNTFNIAATFTETRDSNIVEDTGDYYLAIVRFQLSLQAVPIFIWPLNPNGTANNTFFQVCLSYNGVDYPSFVVFQPSSNGTNDQFNDFFYVFSYQSFLDMINLAYQVSFAALIAANPGLVTTPPYITYNPVSQLFSMNAETRYLSNNATPIKIFMNFRLFLFFDNIKSFANEPMPQLNGKDYQLIIENTGNNFINVSPQFYFNGAVIVPVIAPLSPVVPGFQMQQEICSLGYWQSIRQIRFTTSKIPIRQELFNNSNSFAISNSIIGTNQLPILTDFDVPIEAFINVRTYQNFFAQSEYRLIDMNPSKTFNSIDLQIYWVTNLGVVIPLVLLPHETLDIKFLFRRKLVKNGL